ncbi:MAG: GLUG motif-containing protein [Dehalococcoidia bacterium]
MKTILSSRRDRYLAKFSIFLITVALIAGMVGCVGVRYDLTISSTEGGEVKKPGEATFIYSEGKVVDLVARPEEGHRFVNWTGNVSTIANVTAASTTITMDGDYSITANFTLEIIEICNWDGLHAVRDSLGGNYRLMNTLNSTTANYTARAGPTANGGDGWQPIGTRNDPFTGSFDGQGFEIVDLFINRDERYMGLFGYVDKGGVVQNVTVVNATVTGKDNVGGLVGWNGGTVSSSNYIGSVKGDDSVGGLVGNNGGTVEYSYSTGNVTSEQGSYIGGLVGINDGGTVSSSYSSGSVSGDENVGGLAGGNEKGTVSDSYSTGNVTGNDDVGGLVGYNHNEESIVSVSDSYSTGSVTGDDGVGGLLGFSYKSIVRNSHYNYGEVLINGHNIITIGALNGTDFDQWLAKDKFLDFNGRLEQNEDGYYEVNNVTDFKKLLAFGQDSSLRFILESNLDLSSEPNFYIPYFAGVFDGNDHEISNLSLNFTFAYNIGLFGFLAPGGRVTQVGVENVKITGASFIGGLVGASWEGRVIESYSTGSVTGNYYVGGLVGCNCEEGYVVNSYSTGSVSGDKYVGGLVGDNKFTVEYSHFTGNVTSEGSYIGGLAGRNGHEVRESHSTGSVSGGSRVGGLVGSSNGDTVENSYSSSTVSGHEDVGGLVGNNDDIVENSYSTGNVKGTENVGGLLGSNEGEFVKLSYSTGNVTGNKCVGGLVGVNKKGTVSNCYSTGNVSGDSHVGGLVGENDGLVNSSYSIGRVSDGEDVGGLVGWNDGTVSRSFWDTKTSRQATSAGGIGNTTKEMMEYDTFDGEGWDITMVDDPSIPITGWTWKIVNGKDYPRLGWQTV